VPLGLTLAILLAAPAPALPAASPAEVLALVKRCVAAYGGPTALQAAARLRQHGTVTSLLHPGEKAPILRLYDRVRGLRVEVAWQGAPEVRLVTDGRGWREGQAVQGPPLLAMLLQAARLDLPALLEAARDRVADGGTVLHQGRPLRALVVDLGAGLSVEADLDPDSGRILRSRGASRGTPSLEFVTTYSDFRMVEGVLVAFREESWANGKATGETELTRVAFLESVPEALFKP
jgi:hypothetical protein